jgi:restriction endonuclease Mrr
MPSRRRSKQADGEGIGCLLLILIAGVVYVFDTYPWLWYVVYGFLALLALWVVYKVVTAVTEALQGIKAEWDQQRQLEEAQRQEQVRAQMLAWKEKRNLEEHRKNLLRVLTMVAEVKPEWDRRREEERRTREEERRRREEERKRKHREEVERRREAAGRYREELRKQRAQEEEEKKKRFKETIRQNTFMNRLNQMNGIEFERFMAELFRTKGYSKAQMTPGSGDQGVDLVLTAEDRKIVVQLKRQANPVGNKAVHQAHFGMSYYDADEAWVVTTSSFTQRAREAANKVGVALYGG